MDPKREKITGCAVPVHGNDIDTDRIIPARFLKCVTFDGLRDRAFEDDRLQLKEKGEVHPFDNPKFSAAEILFANKNFGCGSSREHAPQALRRWGKGIKAVVGESFAEIFFGNCVALGIPCGVLDEAGIQKLMAAAETNPKEVFTLDVVAKTLSWSGGKIALSFPDGVRQQFLDGSWDATGQLIAAIPQVLEKAAKLPYFNHWK